MAFVYQEFSSRKSGHLKNWNYAAAATYFVTICTKKRIPFIGEVISLSNKNLFKPSAMGEVISSQWHQIPIIRPDMNIQLGAFQLIPDHLHGIIKIGINKFNQHLYPNNEVLENPLSHSLNYIDTNVSNLPNAHNLHSIIRGFKAAVTKCAITNNLDFDWQRGYYEHIIRSNVELEKIKYYILTNPDRWQV